MKTLQKVRERFYWSKSKEDVEKWCRISYTPSQMLFDREFCLPYDLFFGRPPDTISSLEEYLRDLQARFEDVHNFAREQISMATGKMKMRYDIKTTRHAFQEGGKVWFWNPVWCKVLSFKLKFNWKGLYTVLKRLNYIMVPIRISPFSN